MRILHVGDQLPDIRIERFIQLDAKLGNDSFFLGSINEPLSTHLDHLKPVNACNIDINRSFRLGNISDEHINKIKDVIEEFDPDIIQAHDIFFLNYVKSSLGKIGHSYPVVYNDHELWSETMKLQVKAFMSSLKIDRAVRSYYKLRLYKKWEKKFIPRCVVVTVTEKIASIHKSNYPGIFCTYVPNMPTLYEIKGIDLEERDDERTAVFIGRDFSTRGLPCHNTLDILKTWKKRKPAKLIIIGDPSIESDETVESLGIRPHMSLYSLISRAHFGILPHKSHYFHEYASPNRFYLYLHSGALPVIPRSYNFGIDVPTFTKSVEMFEILEKYPETDQGELQKLAREKIVADNYLDSLKTAYEQVKSL